MVCTLNEAARPATRAGAGFLSLDWDRRSAIACCSKPPRGRSVAGPGGSEGARAAHVHAGSKAHARGRVTFSSPHRSPAPPQAALERRSREGSRERRVFPRPLGGGGDDVGAAPPTIHSLRSRPASGRPLPVSETGNPDRGRRAHQGCLCAQVHAAPSSNGAGTVGPGGCGPRRAAPRPL